MLILRPSNREPNSRAYTLLEKQKYLKDLIVERLKDTNQENTITSRELCRYLNVSFRRLKEIINELREDYPICAKETNGGGYWIARSQLEIRAYIAMLDRRVSGHIKNITAMARHMKVGEPDNNFSDYNFKN